jgi:hypothetical protein
MNSTHVARGIKALAANKREDKNYRQLCGYIPKDLALKFKLAYTSADLDQSEGMEAALRLWTEQQTTEKKS